MAEVETSSHSLPDLFPNATSKQVRYETNNNNTSSDPADEPDTAATLSKPHAPYIKQFESGQNRKIKTKHVVDAVTPLAAVSVDPIDKQFEHRHYSALHPTCNKLLEKRWEDHTRDLHYRRLKHVKPSIDNSQPRVYPHLEMRLKRMQIEEERLRDIERKNHILLDRIVFQTNHNAEVSNLNPQKEEARLFMMGAGDQKRKRELHKIKKENLTILQRIEDKAPNYNRLEWLADRRKNIGYLFNISQYPTLYLRRLEEFRGPMDHNRKLRIRFPKNRYKKKEKEVKKDEDTPPKPVKKLKIRYLKSKPKPKPLPNPPAESIPAKVKKEKVVKPPARVKSVKDSEAKSPVRYHSFSNRSSLKQTTPKPSTPEKVVKHVEPPYPFKPSRVSGLTGTTANPTSSSVPISPATSPPATRKSLKSTSKPSSIPANITAASPSPSQPSSSPPPLQESEIQTLPALVNTHSSPSSRPMSTASKRIASPVSPILPSEPSYKDLEDKVITPRSMKFSPSPPPLEPTESHHDVVVNETPEYTNEVFEDEVMDPEKIVVGVLDNELISLSSENEGRVTARTTEGGNNAVLQDDISGFFSGQGEPQPSSMLPPLSPDSRLIDGRERVSESPTEIKTPNPPVPMKSKTKSIEQLPPVHAPSVRGSQPSSRRSSLYSHIQSKVGSIRSKPVSKSNSQHGSMSNVES